MSKYIDADASRNEFMESVYDILTEDGTNDRANEIIDVFDALPAADVEPVRHDLIEKVKKYAADMEERYTEVCADFRERTGQDYVCGACKYGDCVYIGADGDYCGECPGFESDECFVLSDELKRKIWEIVDIVSGAKMDGGSE